MSEPSRRARRARRIRDEEWDSHRPEIERLLSEGMPRKEVTERLTRSGFPVTMKQLKDILKRWNLKRKICHEDMESMLVTQNLRNANGQRTQFTYYGLPVSEAKLQRAAKRIRILSPTAKVMPPHIRLVSPQLDDQSPLLSWRDAARGIEPCNPELFQTSLPDDMTLISYTAEDAYLPLTRQNLGFDLNNTGFDLPAHQDHQGLLFSTGIMQEAPSSDGSFYNAFDALASETINVRQNVFDEMPWSGDPSAGDLAALPTPVPDSAIPSRLSTPLLTRDLTGSHNGQPSILRGCPDEMTPATQVLFHGSDPENAVHAVQLMRNLFQKLRNEAFRCSHAFFYGKSQRKLADEINGDLLLSQIDDLAIWIYEASARFIRNKRAAYKLSISDSARSLWPSSAQNTPQAITSGVNSASNGTDPPPLRTPITNYCRFDTKHTTVGTFRIALQQAQNKDLDEEGHAAYNISITVIPKVRTRQEAGIFAAFPRGFQSQPIYPVIRTFHVVPEDSEIINTIRMNDLVGFRKVIEEGRGSPRDVSPDGKSLLFYAIFSESLELFQYIVENGADADQCPIDCNPASLVDCIWTEHVELTVATDAQIVGFSTGALIHSLDQCRAMADIARKSGFLAEESVPFKETVPTALFWMIRSYSNKASSRLDETLNSLLTAGYDIEFRNSIGQTPLLYAAYSLGRYTLEIVELLLAKNSDRNAVDHQGRGVLHTCLAFSDSLNESFDEVCTSSTIPAHAQSDAAGDLVTETSSNMASEDGALFDDIGSEHSSDSVSIEPAVIDDSESIYIDDTESTLCYWCEEPYVESSADLLCYSSLRDVDSFDISHAALYDNNFRDAEPEPWMCKARARLKLLRFLRAGCDPNLRDFGGATPSDYARREELWPQWEWALERSDWKYDEESGLCVAKVEELEN